MDHEKTVTFRPFFHCHVFNCKSTHHLVVTLQGLVSALTKRASQLGMLESFRLVVYLINLFYLS